MAKPMSLCIVARLTASSCGGLNAIGQAGPCAFVRAALWQSPCGLGQHMHE
jgi:hypothetical protein